MVEPWFVTRCRALALVFLAASLAACATTNSDTPTVATPGAQDSLAQTHVKLGVGYLQQGQRELALTKLQRALQLDDKLPTAHNAIAITYEQLGNMEEAEKHYLRALSLAPSDSNAQNNYGAFLCKRNELDKAEQYFLKAIENPLYATPDFAYENAGLCAVRVPNTVKAEKYFRSALQINPQRPASLYQMGVISFDRGEHLSARAYLQRYSAVASHTAQSLWLGIRTERILGDKNAVSSFALQLRSQYPDSDETRLMGETEGRASSPAVTGATEAEPAGTESTETEPAEVES